MTKTLKDLQDLIAEHEKLWEADRAAWRAFGNISELKEIRELPPLRVQIGSTILYRDENNQDVKEPRYFGSEKTIETEYRRWAENGIGLFVRPDDTAGIAKRVKECEAKAAEKVAELDAIRAERKRIEDACGYTAAEEKVDETGAAVKAIERLIIGFVPEDIETARLLAGWTVDSYENEVGYLVCDDDQRLQVLASIAGRIASGAVDG